MSNLNDLIDKNHFDYSNENKAKVVINKSFASAWNV